MQKKLITTLLTTIILFSKIAVAAPIQVNTNTSTQTQQQSKKPFADNLYKESLELIQKGTPESLQQALVKLEDVLLLRRQLGDKYLEADTLVVIGQVYLSLGDNQKALEKFNQSLPLWRQIKNKESEAGTLGFIGQAYYALKNNSKALEFYNQSLSIYIKLGIKGGEANVLYSIAQVYNASNDKPKALAFYKQSLSLFRTVGFKQKEADTLIDIAHVYSDLKERQRAIEYYQQSLTLYSGNKYQKEQAYILLLIGSNYSRLNQGQKAIEAYHQSLSLYRILKNKKKESLVLNNIGFVYSEKGDKLQALEFYQKALALVREIGSKTDEAVYLNNIGKIYSDFGDFETALSYSKQSLEIVRAIGQKYTEVSNLMNLGGIYSQTGEKQKALDSLNQALNILPFLDDSHKKERHASILNNIGAIYQDLNDNQKALELYQQSLKILQAIGSKNNEASTLTNIGIVYSDMGNYEKALELYNQSLKISRTINDKFSENYTLSSIGSIYEKLENKQKALELYNQALQKRKALGDKRGEALTLSSIASVYSSLGDKQKALSVFQESLSLSRAITNKELEASNLASIAYIQGGQKDLQPALINIEAAIKIIENLRTKVASQELRTSFFASKQDYYKFQIDVLMELHKQQPNKGYDAQALHVNEKARARSLIELLSEAGANVRSGIDTKLIERQKAITLQLNAAEFHRYQLSQGQYTNKELEQVKQKVASSLSQLEQVKSEIRSQNPRYAALTQPQPLTLKEIQKEVLDDKTLLLEYSLGKDYSFLWAVTKTGVTSYKLPKRETIEKTAQEFYKQVVSGKEVNPEISTKLSQILLAPVANQLKGKRLLIVGDGALQSIPFAALPTPQVDKQELIPLLVNHEIVTLPSASTIAIQRRQLQNRPRNAKTVAIFADPVFNRDDARLKKADDTASNITASPKNSEVTRSASDIGVVLERLKYSRQEAEAILKLVNDTNARSSALDFSANRSTATNPNMSQYQIIHFATHGLVNTVNPELSGIVLSLVNEKGADIDGFLRLHDIFNFNLPVELVVLSACETGLGKDIKGEGLIGLTRGFMYAGAKRVAVSLWSVNDLATANLMTKFYQHMLQKGLTPVAAMRAAQLEMWKKEQWKAPYYWAAFTVQGDWQ